MNKKSKGKSRLSPAEKKKYEKIFQDATALLIKNHAFFGHILANMVRISTDRVNAMSVSINGSGQIVLFYNTHMIKREIEENNSTLKNITGMVKHEIYHIINEHFLREMEGKFNAWIITPAGPMKLFNVAADLAINQYIDSLPDWTLNLNSFQGVELPNEEIAEVYYKLLYKKAKENSEKNKDDLNDLGEAVGIMMHNDDQKQKPSGIEKQSDKSGTNQGKDKDGGENKDENKSGEGQGNTKEESDIDKINKWLPFDKQKFEEFMDDLRKKGKLPTSKETGMSGDHSKWRDVEKVPGEMVDATIKQAVKEAYNRAKFGGKGIGNLPAGIDRMCKETLKPAYNFEPFLRRFVDGQLFGRYVRTRKRPNRRYRWEHPGRKVQTKGKIAVLADTSGSIYDEDIALFAKNLEKMNQYVQIILFDVDYGINNVREYSKRNFDKAMKGGGGTDFEAVFKVIDNYKKNKFLLENIPSKQQMKARTLCQGIQALIVMTDGMATGCPEKKPRYPVMWALTDKCFGPPRKYGHVIYLDNDVDNHKGRRMR
jgi:predicted metal-dependent peptidase